MATGRNLVLILLLASLLSSFVSAADIPVTACGDLTGDTGDVYVLQNDIVGNGANCLTSSGAVTINGNGYTVTMETANSAIQVTGSSLSAYNLNVINPLSGSISAIRSYGDLHLWDSNVTMTGSTTTGVIVGSSGLAGAKINVTNVRVELVNLTGGHNAIYSTTLQSVVNVINSTITSNDSTYPLTRFVRLAGLYDGARVRLAGNTFSCWQGDVGATTCALMQISSANGADVEFEVSDNLFNGAIGGVYPGGTSRFTAFRFLRNNFSFNRYSEVAIQTRGYSTNFTVEFINNTWAGGSVFGYGGYNWGYMGSTASTIPVLTEGNVFNDGLYFNNGAASTTPQVIRGNVFNQGSFGELVYFGSSGEEGYIYNNVFNGTGQVDTTSMTAYMNTTQTTGPNILGGPYIGGNYYTNPTGTGYSDTCAYNALDGVCDVANGGDELTLNRAYVSTVGFDGETTNFANGSLLFSQPIVEKTGSARVQWTGSDLNFTRADFRSRFTYAPNFISIDSANLPAAVNTSANVTLYGDYSTWTSPVIKKDGVTCADCTLFAYNASGVYFNVSGFSNYTLENGTVGNADINLTACGLVLNSSQDLRITLQNDVSLGDVCVRFDGAGPHDNVTVDCAGYTVHMNESTTFGRYLVGGNSTAIGDIVIENCVIDDTQGSSLVAMDSGGVYMNNISGNNLYSFVAQAMFSCGGMSYAILNNSVIEVDDSAGATLFEQNCAPTPWNISVINSAIKIVNPADTNALFALGSNSQVTLVNSIINVSSTSTGGGGGNGYLANSPSLTTWIFNMTQQAGTNIIGGSQLGGNYWVNSSGTGYSETCTGDGTFCTTPYDVFGDASAYDYLPLTNNSVNVTFTHSDNGAEVDCLTPSVCLTRPAGGGALYNSLQEGGWNGVSSPVGTEWSWGRCDDLKGYGNYAGTYIGNGFDYFYNIFGQSSVGQIINNNLNVSMCIRSVAEDLYFNIQFTAWTQSGGGGGFSYVRDAVPSSFNANITGCTRTIVNQSNLELRMTKDINVTQYGYSVPCVNVDASNVNVTLDCQGHSFFSDASTGNGRGAPFVNSDSSGFTMKNCMLNDYEDTPSFLYPAVRTSELMYVINSTIWSMYPFDVPGGSLVVNGSTINVFDPYGYAYTYGFGTLSLSDITVVNSVINDASGSWPPTSASYACTGSATFYNNLVNVSDPMYVGFMTAGACSPVYANTTATAGTNIIGGSTFGGNYWANPSGTGYSETCAGDGTFCTASYDPFGNANAIDYLPLTNNAAAPYVSNYSLARDLNYIWYDDFNRGDGAISRSNNLTRNSTSGNLWRVARDNASLVPNLTVEILSGVLRFTSDGAYNSQGSFPSEAIGTADASTGTHVALFPGATYTTGTYSARARYYNLSSYGTFTSGNLKITYVLLAHPDANKRCRIQLRDTASTPSPSFIFIGSSTVLDTHTSSSYPVDGNWYDNTIFWNMSSNQCRMVMNGTFSNGYQSFDTGWINFGTNPLAGDEYLTGYVTNTSSEAGILVDYDDFKIYSGFANPEIKYATYDGATSDFLNNATFSNWSALPQPVIEKSSYGRVRWAGGALNFRAADFDTYGYFQPNLVGLDSANLPTDVNTAADVTIYGDYSTWMNPYVLKDGVACGGSCTGVTINSSGAYFTVTGFSNYTIGNGSANFSNQLGNIKYHFPFEQTLRESRDRVLKGVDTSLLYTPVAVNYGVYEDAQSDKGYWSNASGMEIAAQSDFTLMFFINDTSPNGILQYLWEVGTDGGGDSKYEVAQWTDGSNQSILLLYRTDTDVENVLSCGNDIVANAVEHYAFVVDREPAQDTISCYVNGVLQKTGTFTSSYNSSLTPTGNMAQVLEGGSGWSSGTMHLDELFFLNSSVSAGELADYYANAGTYDLPNWVADVTGTDGFEDGDYTYNPTWTPQQDDGDWSVITTQTPQGSYALNFSPNGDSRWEYLRSPLVAGKVLEVGDSFGGWWKRSAVGIADYVARVVFDDGSMIETVYWGNASIVWACGGSYQTGSPISVPVVAWYNWNWTYTGAGTWNYTIRNESGSIVGSINASCTVGLRPTYAELKYADYTGYGSVLTDAITYPYSNVTGQTHSWSLNNVLTDDVGNITLANQGASFTTAYPSYNRTGSGSTHSIYFNGSTFLNGTNPIIGGTNFTVSLWVKLSNTSTYPLRYFTTGKYGGPTDRGVDFGQQGGDGKTTFCYAGTQAAGSFDQCVVSTNTISNGTWHHLVGVRNGTNAYLYIDGVLNATSSTGTMNETRAPSSNNMVVGAWYSSGYGLFMNGSLDELKTFNAALTATQVQNLYNCGQTADCPAPPASVINYYTCENDVLDKADGLDITNSGISFSTDVPVFNVSGKGGSYSCEFNNSENDRGTIATNHLVGDTTYAMSVWVKLRSGNDFAMFLQQGNNLGDRSYMLYHDNTRRPSFSIGAPGGGTFSCDAALGDPLVVGQWYNIVGVQNGTACDLYVNGVKTVGNQTGNATPLRDSTVKQTIGAYNGQPSLYDFDGWMDEIKFFDGSLNQTEISNLYNCGQTTTNCSANLSSVLLYYSFDNNQTCNNVAYDSTGAHNGTIATLSPPVTGFSGKIGQSIFFNASAKTNVTDGNVSNVRSLSMWINTNGVTEGSSCTIPFSTGSNYVGFGNCANPPSGELVLLYHSASDKRSVWNASDFPSNISAGWHHYLFAWDSAASEYRLYFDSVDKGYGLTFTNGGAPTSFVEWSSPWTTVRVGADAFGDYFNGYIDEVSLYSDVLGQTQATELYNGGAGYNPLSSAQTSCGGATVIANYTRTSYNNGYWITYPGYLGGQQFTPNSSAYAYNVTSMTTYLYVQGTKDDNTTRTLTCGIYTSNPSNYTPGTQIGSNCTASFNPVTLSSLYTTPTQVDLTCSGTQANVRNGTQYVMVCGADSTNIIGWTAQNVGGNYSGGQLLATINNNSYWDYGAGGVAGDYAFTIYGTETQQPSYWWGFNNTLADYEGALLTGSPVYNASYRTYPVSGSGTPYSVEFTGGYSPLATPNITLGSQYSVCFDMRPNVAGQNAAMFSENGVMEPKLQMLLVSGELTPYAGAYYPSGGTNVFPAVGVWTHVCFVSTGSNMSTYVNGSLVSSPSGTQTMVSKKFAIGSLDPYSNFGYNFNGGIDEVHVYTRALNSSEVSNLYQCGNESVSVCVSSQTAPVNHSLIQYNDVGDTDQTYIDYDNIRAQGYEFTANASYMLYDVGVLFGENNGNPQCGLQMSVWSGNGTQPTTRLANFSFKANSSITPSAWNYFSNNRGFNLVNGTTYWIVLEANQSCGVNYYHTRFAPTGTGVYAYADSTMAWSGLVGSRSGMWRTYGVTLSPISSISHYWTFDNNATGTKDLIGSSNWSVEGNVQSVGGSKLGTGMLGPLSGTNRLNMSSVLSGQTQFCLGLWTKTPNAFGQYDTLISTNGVYAFTSSPEFNYGQYFEGLTQDSADVVYGESYIGTAATNATFYHMAFSYNGSQYIICRNGECFNYTTQNRPLKTHTYMFIGNDRQFGVGRSYNGYIDDMWVLNNQSCTQGQLLWSYNGGTGRSMAEFGMSKSVTLVSPSNGTQVTTVDTDFTFNLAGGNGSETCSLVIDGVARNTSGGVSDGQWAARASQYLIDNNYDNTTHNWSVQCDGANSSVYGVTVKDPAYSYKIDFCRTLDTNGTYELTQNISGSGYCLDIPAALVNVDCKRYSVTSTGNGALSVSSSLSNVNVTNCVMQQAAGSAVSLQGSFGDRRFSLTNSVLNGSGNAFELAGNYPYLVFTNNTMNVTGDVFYVTFAQQGQLYAYNNTLAGRYIINGLSLGGEAYPVLAGNTILNRSGVSLEVARGSSVRWTSGGRMYNNLLYVPPTTENIGALNHTLNVPKTYLNGQKNIVGGCYLAGNAYAYDNTMNSCTDADIDGICDSGRFFGSYMWDGLPLKNGTYDCSEVVLMSPANGTQLTSVASNFTFRRNAMTNVSCGVYLDGASQNSTFTGLTDGLFTLTASSFLIDNNYDGDTHNWSVQCTQANSTTQQWTVRDTAYPFIVDHCRVMMEGGNYVLTQNLSASAQYPYLNISESGFYTACLVMNATSFSTSGYKLDCRGYSIVGQGNASTQHGFWSTDYVSYGNVTNCTFSNHSVSDGYIGANYALVNSSRLAYITDSRFLSSFGLTTGGVEYSGWNVARNVFSGNVYWGGYNTWENNVFNGSIGPPSSTCWRTQTFYNNTFNGPLSIGGYRSGGTYTFRNNTMKSVTYAACPGYNTVPDQVYVNNIMNNTFYYGSGAEVVLNGTFQNGSNIIGGLYLGGNYWTNATGGFSDGCFDYMRDGICDEAYTYGGAVDYLPLTLYRDCYGNLSQLVQPVNGSTIFSPNVSFELYVAPFEIANVTENGSTLISTTNSSVNTTLGPFAEAQHTFTMTSEDVSGCSVPVQRDTTISVVLSPNITAYLCAALTYPNEDDAPFATSIPVNFSVFGPLGFTSPSIDINLTLGGTKYTVDETGCSYSGNSTFRNYACNVTMHHWYTPGAYDLSIAFVEQGYYATVQQSGVCTYGQLIAYDRTTNAVGFPGAAPGIANASGDQPVHVRNTGNMNLSLAMVAYDLSGRTYPGVTLGAQYFRAGESLPASVQMQNALSKNLSMMLPAGNGTSEDIYLWLSMPLSQQLQDYYAATPWVLEGQG